LLLGKQQWHSNLRRLNPFNLRPRSSVKHQRDLVQWHPQPPVAASAPKPGGSPKKGEVKPAVDPVQTPTTGADSTKPEPSAPSLPGAEGVDKMAIDEASGDAPEVAEELDPALEEEMSMEEMIRVTRAKLRRRTTTEVPAGN
jgi:receptor expression-enhancing protein 1/2/3/4